MVIPPDIDDVIAAVAVCAASRVPVLPRGAGTSLAGQCCNIAVVIDFTRHLNRILEIDADARTARVEPGCVLDDLRDAAEKFGLTFGPDPATHRHNTLGGMVGNNSCGVHSVMAGRTADNVEALEMLTYTGCACGSARPSSGTGADYCPGGSRAEIYAGLKQLRDRTCGRDPARYPDIPRRVSGYNLDELLPEKGFNVARALVGSEGTCVIVLRAKLRLVSSPRARSLLVLGYRDVFAAGDHVGEILAAGAIGLEGIDDRC